MDFKSLEASPSKLAKTTQATPTDSQFRISEKKRRGSALMLAEGPQAPVLMSSLLLCTCSATVSLVRYLSTHSKYSPKTLKHIANGSFQHFPLTRYLHLADHFNCLLGWPTWPNHHSEGVGVFHWINCFYCLDQSSRLKEVTQTFKKLNHFWPFDQWFD